MFFIIYLYKNMSNKKKRKSINQFPRLQNNIYLSQKMKIT